MLLFNYEEPYPKYTCIDLLSAMRLFTPLYRISDWHLFAWICQLRNALRLREIYRNVKLMIQHILKGKRKGHYYLKLLM